MSHIPNRSVNFALQVTQFRVLQLAHRDYPSVFLELDRIFLDVTPYAVKEAVCTLDVAVRPLKIIVRRSGKQNEQPYCVRAVFLDHLGWVNSVAERFAHLCAVLDDHSLSEQSRKRLASFSEAYIGQELCEEAGVNQVKASVLDSSDVLVNRHPVIYVLLLERSVLTARRAIPVEVP